MKFDNMQVVSIWRKILCLIILISFILVGSPISYNCIALNGLIIITGIIYILYKIFKKKQNVINRKIDIVVLIFCITPLIPLVFNAYSSLEETLISVIKYISLFNLYIMTKDELIKEENWITNLLICGGVILAILGIDEMTSKILMNHIEVLKLPYVINYENRMFSTLGYANSFAIIMAIVLFISISKCKIEKESYSGFIFIFLSMLLLSYSRGVLVIFAILFIIYMILLKGKEKIYLLYVAFINLILSLIYMKLFEMLVPDENYVLLWLMTVILFVASIIIAKVITKQFEKLLKIKKSTYIIIIGVFIVFVGLICIIGVNLDVPLQIFSEGEENDEVRYNIYNIVPNKQYIFKFDINAKSKLNNIENYSIKIIEENKYYDTVKEHEIKFNNFEGTKTIEFVASEETHSVAMLINNSVQIAQQGLTINSLYVNEDEYTLDYLYLPVKLVKRIENFILENKSINERLIFYIDGLKIVNSNMLLGTGGRGWLYNYEKVQTYVYGASEIHNYLLQILIENGIISLFAWIAMVVYAGFCILKRLKNRKIKVTDFAFLLLTMHSLVDFDMSFYCIMVIWFILFALTIKKDNNENEKSIENKLIIKKKIDYIMPIILVIINILVIGLSIYAVKLRQDNSNILAYLEDTKKYQNENEVIELIKKYTTNERYDKFYNVLEKINYQNITQENLQFVYERLEKEELVVNTEYNMERNLVIKQILETSKDKEILKKFSSIILDENEQILNNIKNRDKNRLTESEIEEYLETQQEIYELALENQNKE